MEEEKLKFQASITYAQKRRKRIINNIREKGIKPDVYRDILEKTLYMITERGVADK